jgi:hypothetical protein
MIILPKGSTPLNENILAIEFKIRCAPSKKTLLSRYLPIKSHILEITCSFRASIFPKPYRGVISMLYFILIYNDDNTIDEAILNVMEVIFPLSKLSLVQYFHAEYLAHAIYN